MHSRRKHKSDADLAQALGNARRRDSYVYTESLHHVSRAAPGGDAAIAVLGHAHARACDSKRGCGGDIKRVTGIAAGSAGIDQSFTFCAADIERAAITVGERHRRSA